MNETQQEHQYPLNSIYFYLTEGCNLRCRHYWIAPPYQSEKRTYPTLELEVFRSILQLVFGHASQDRLETVWNETPILQQIRAGLPDRLTGVCAECLLKNRCLGSCVAQSCYRNQDLWSPYWYCQEAKDKGIFPITRLQEGKEEGR